MALTRKQIRNAVVANTGRSDKLDVINNAIDEALVMIGQANDFKQSRYEQELQVAAGDLSVALPDGVNQIAGLLLVDGVQSYSMILWPKPRLVGRYPNPAAASPCRPVYCYEEQGAIYFSAPSLGAYVIRASLVQYPTIGPDDDAVCSVSGLEPAVTAYATSYLFDSIQDSESSDRWRARFNTALVAAIQADARRPGVNRDFSLPRQVPDLRGPSAESVYDPFAGRR